MDPPRRIIIGAGSAVQSMGHSSWLNGATRLLLLEQTAFPAAQTSCGRISSLFEVTEIFRAPWHPDAVRTARRGGRFQEGQPVRHQHGGSHSTASCPHGRWGLRPLRLAKNPLGPPPGALLKPEPAALIATPVTATVRGSLDDGFVVSTPIVSTAQSWVFGAYGNAPPSWTEQTGAWPCRPSPRSVRGRKATLTEAITTSRRWKAARHSRGVIAGLSAIESGLISTSGWNSARRPDGRQRGRPARSSEGSCPRWRYSAAIIPGQPPAGDGPRRWIVAIL